MQYLIKFKFLELNNLVQFKPIFINFKCKDHKKEDSLAYLLQIISCRFCPLFVLKLGFFIIIAMDSWFGCSTNFYHIERSVGSVSAAVEHET